MRLAAWATAFAAVGATSPSAETIDVQYRGKIDLFEYWCEDVSRSSFIYRVCFNEAKASMIINLNNSYYEYCGVDAATVGDLLTAESLGRHYNRFIKSSATGGRFDCRNF